MNNIVCGGYILVIPPATQSMTPTRKAVDTKVSQLVKETDDIIQEDC